MTRIASSLIASLALFATPALSADLPVKASPAPISLYNWTGCFGGINGGGARSDNAWQPLAGAVLATVGPNGFFGGGEIGCDYQAGPLVVGFEAQFDWIDAESAALAQGAAATEVRSRMKLFGTAAARIGYAFDRILPYVKFGLAGARYRQEMDMVGASVTPFLQGDQNVLGIAAGAGVEVAVFSNLSFKAEYAFAYLGSNGATLDCVSPAFCAGAPSLGVGIRQDFQSVLFGVNYRFAGY